MFDLIVVRESMLAENYGADLWHREKQIPVLRTPPITNFCPEDLKHIQGKSVLIVGGYFRANMDPIIDSASNVTVFFNTSDLSKDVPYSTIFATENKGFLSWTIQELNIQDDVIKRISTHMDAYLYGFPTEEDMCFQKGVYTITSTSDLEKILSLSSVEDVNQIIEQGRKARTESLRVAQQRKNCSKQITFSLKGREYSATVGIGDSPVVDTCLILSETTGLGILFRYNLNMERTFISARTTKESGIDAGVFMKDLANGGGSSSMGGGSVDGLHIPEDFLRSLE